MGVWVEWRSLNDDDDDDGDISTGSNLGANKNYTLPYKQARRRTVDNKEGVSYLPKEPRCLPPTCWPPHP